MQKKPKGCRIRLTAPHGSSKVSALIIPIRACYYSFGVTQSWGVQLFLIGCSDSITENVNDFLDCSCSIAENVNDFAW